MDEATSEFGETVPHDDRPATNPAAATIYLKFIIFSPIYRGIYARGARGVNCESIVISRYAFGVRGFKTFLRGFLVDLFAGCGGSGGFFFRVSFRIISDRRSRSSTRSCSSTSRQNLVSDTHVSTTAVLTSQPTGVRCLWAGRIVHPLAFTSDEGFDFGRRKGHALSFCTAPDLNERKLAMAD
jgi:hypothetical protein